ncbi:tyrosine--tRNA ligase [Candidatus Falkowbacteria bacterium]|nr:tyrosine--tRNA ligase [Candidatus Falkowbacteria bacterium]
MAKNKVSLYEKKIEALLTRGVDEAIEEEHLRKRLLKGCKLRVKFGIDPTGSELHLGHVVPLRKLRQFQKLGHQIIFLIGDYTAKVGDPSGRSETRKILTDKEIKENMKDYSRQAGKILDMGKVEVRYNSEWFDNKGAMFLFELTSKFTLARVIERDDFKKRIKDDIDVSVLEILYPLMQGYDSVALEADVEIGGTDQKFNLLMGRRVQRKYGQKEQDIVTVPLIEGTDGVRKMSKSFGNYIGVTEKPKEIYGKTMSIPDSLIWKYYKLLTDVRLDRINKMKKDVKAGDVNPRDVKAELASEVVTLFYNKKEAEKAGKEFDKMFRDKEVPEDVDEVKMPSVKCKILDIIVKAKLVASKSEGRRMVEQGGVKIDGKKVSDWDREVKIKDGMVVQVGKRRFARIKIK